MIRTWMLGWLALGSLAIWVQFVSVLPCWLALIPIAVVAGVIAHGIYEFKKSRRRAWSNQYLQESGRLFRLLQPGWLMRTVSGLLGLMLAVVLLMPLLRWSTGYWALLAVNVPIFLLVAEWTRRRSRTEVHPHWVSPLSRVFTVRVNVLLLTPALLLMDLFADQRHYRGAPYEQVLENVSGQVDLACASIEAMLRSMVYARELSYWVLQNAVGGFEAGGIWAVFAWVMLFLASGGAAWAWSRFLMGLCYFMER